MKIQNFTLKLVLTVIFVIIAGAVSAQDIIKKNSGEEIKAIIQEVGNYEVTYKLFDKPDGETKILKKNLIYSIHFSNGDKEVFNRQETTEYKQPEQQIYEQRQPEQPKTEPLPSPDIIILNDGDIVEGFVKEIGLDDVKYKKAGNPNGPTYTLRQASISKIQYANGWEEQFAVVTKPPVQEYSKPEEKQDAVVREPIREETPQYYQQTPVQEQPYETQKKPNPNKFRVYFGAGIGNSYGIIGGNVEFRFSHFAFHGGVGWYPLANNLLKMPAWSAGFKGYVWRNLYLNTVVGTIGHYEEHKYIQSGGYSYYSAYYEPIIGVSELVGYQWAWGNSVRFGINLGAGISVAFINKPLITGSIVSPAFDFGISLSFGTKKN